MKTLCFLLLTLVFCVGCATQYRVTLSNGNYYMSHGKPHYDKNKDRWVFKDASGRQFAVSPLAIREIAPESMETAGKNFVPPPPTK
jgi:uncharacterized protein YcfL